MKTIVYCKIIKAKLRFAQAVNTSGDENNTTFLFTNNIPHCEILIAI
jgi:hypothetical protein